jgi:SAM-dependent methyltransferase
MKRSLSYAFKSAVKTILTEIGLWKAIQKIRPKPKLIILTSEECLSLKSRNDIFEDYFYRAEDYFLEKKSYTSSRNWDIQVDNVPWFNDFNKLPVANLAKAYHGIFVQWWEYFYPDAEKKIKVLLTGESIKVGKQLSAIYKHWDVSTTDLYHELREQEGATDYLCDLCSPCLDVFGEEKFDLIISQANIEHVYDPFRYMVNLASLLSNDGRLFVHTVTPGFPYHAFPRDYFRFFSDWFIDFPENLKKHAPEKIIEVEELLNIRKNLTKNSIFVCYKRK